MEKKCLTCFSPITGKYSSNKKFCSKKCLKVSKEDKFLKNNPIIFDLSSGTIGAISELIICVDLLKKGFGVFRSVSPACFCDLAIMVGKKLYRIEVTTGNYSSKKTPMHSKNDDREKFDILAIVMKDGLIFYEPELPLNELMEEYEKKS